MYKKKGFSLLELLVVMGIIALLALISIPSFSRMQSRSNFKTEINTIFDQLLEVRINALTGKMCDGMASKNWIFSLGATTSSISCTKIDDSVFVKQTYAMIWNQSHAIQLDDINRSSLQIEFLPDTAQSFIPDGTEQRINAKILFTHSSGDVETICFNRVAGIPELSNENTDCTP